jgi:hypothetical protein
MMNCSDARPLLAMHPDPDEPSDVRAAVDGHLAACHACAAEARRLRAAWKALDVLEDLPPSPGFAGQVRARVRSARRPAWLPLAAAAGLLVAATVLLTIPAVPPVPGLSPAEIDIVKNLDLLENYEMVEAIDLLSSEASLDEVAPLLDLLDGDAGASGRKAQEY